MSVLKRLINGLWVPELEYPVYTDEQARLAAPPEDESTIGTLIHESTDKTVLANDDEFSIWNSITGLSARIKKSSFITQLNSLYESARLYTGSTIGIDSTLTQAVTALDKALTISEFPVTSIAAGSWATASGSVTDLATLSDTSMVFTEGGGANSFVELLFDNVTNLSMIHIHYRYYSTSGSPTTHTTDWQVYRAVSGWESIGVITSTNTTLLDLLSKQLEDITGLITDDANKRVRVRFLHVSNTAGTHRLELKHAIAAHGIAIVGAVTSHIGLGGRDLTNQHPATAIAVDASAFTDPAIINSQLAAARADASLPKLDVHRDITASDNVLVSDGGKSLRFTSATGANLTFPSVAGFPEDWQCTIHNDSANAVDLTFICVISPWFCTGSKLAQKKSVLVRMVGGTWRVTGGAS